MSLSVPGGNFAPMKHEDGDYLNHVRLLEGTGNIDVRTWIKDNRGQVEEALIGAGAVLFRGFKADDETIAHEVLGALSGELLEDAFWSTPRSGVSGKTFTATEYPGPRTIALHSELAYMKTWPQLLAFHSLKVADEGGETTIGNLDDISDDLGDLLERFKDGVIYQRSFHEGVDIPWQTAFRTESRSEAENVAKKNGMTCSWGADGSLQTSHQAQGCIESVKGKRLWFNQSHVFHASNLPPVDRKTLTEIFGEEGLPRNCVFADGTRISDEIVSQVSSVLSRRAMGVRWQAGDVLIIDNVRFMHGRLPFKGSRKVHVAMANACSGSKQVPLFQKKKGFGARLWDRLAG